MPFKLDIADILRYGYGIQDFRIIAEHHGSQSLVWRIHAKDREYGLRQTRDLDDEKLQSYCHLTCLLKENGIPVTCPIESEDGKPFFRYAGDSFIMCNWIDGVVVREKKLKIEEAEFLGEILARVHQILADCKKSICLRKRQYVSNASTLRDIEQLMKFLDSKVRKNKYDKAAYSELKHKHALLSNREEQNNEILRRLYDEECQLVHGDFNWGNILYTSNGKFAGLIDLDTFHYAPRIWDVVKACMFTFAANSNYCIRFLSSYHHVNPLTTMEINAFHPLAIDYMLKNIWGYKEYLLNGNPNIALHNTVFCFNRLISDEHHYRNLSFKIAR